MCASNLLELFKSCLCEFPEAKPNSVLPDFEKAVACRKYDIQDKTIIEAVLKEEGDSLKQSFVDAFGNWMKSQGEEWSADKSAKAVEIFFVRLETLVNYYYSNTIAGQFS